MTLIRIDYEKKLYVLHGHQNHAPTRLTPEDGTMLPRHPLMVNDYLCRFVEMVPIRPIRRNPKIFDGRLITVTQQKDGSLRFNFKPVRLSEELTANDYAVGVAREIKEALGAW